MGESPPPVNSMVTGIASLNDDVFDHILTFLDTKNIKSFRQVCQRWNTLAFPELKKRSVVSFGLPQLSPSNYHVDEEMDLRIASFYPNWRVSYEFLAGIHPSRLEHYGLIVKYLHIHSFTVKRDSCERFRKTIPYNFPNLFEIFISFEDSNQYNSSEWQDLLSTTPLVKNTEDFSDFMDGKFSEEEFNGKLQSDPGHVFQPIPDFPHVRTLRFGSRVSLSGECFAFRMIEACPNLRNLHLEQSAFKTVKYLTSRGDITRKLEKFEWKVRDDEKGNEPFYTEKEMNFGSGPHLAYTDIRPIQFSDKLTTLSWGALHFGNVADWENAARLKILPGTLDSIAGNVTKLSTRLAIWDPRLEFEDKIPLSMMNVEFPMMPKLSTIEIGIRTIYTISLNDLVDAAPNLRRLEIQGTTGVEILILPDAPMIRPNDIWRGTLLSDQMAPHGNLREFVSEVSFRDKTVLRQTLKKFPKLEELSVGRRSISSRIELEELFDILKEMGSKLKRLKWKHGNTLTLYSLCSHLMDVDKLETLELYELSHEIALPIRHRRFEHCLRPHQHKCRTMEWNGPGRVNLNHQEPTEVHLDFKQYLLRQEEHLTDLISLKGGKCKIFIECEQLKWNGQTPCSIISHEGQNCKAVMQDFRDFIRDNDIPILIS